MSLSRWDADVSKVQFALLCLPFFLFFGGAPEPSPPVNCSIVVMSSSDEDTHEAELVLFTLQNDTYTKTQAIQQSFSSISALLDGQRAVGVVQFEPDYSVQIFNIFSTHIALSSILSENNIPSPFWLNPRQDGWSFDHRFLAFRSFMLDRNNRLFVKDFVEDRIFEIDFVEEVNNVMWSQDSRYMAFIGYNIHYLGSYEIIDLAIYIITSDGAVFTSIPFTFDESVRYAWASDTELVVTRCGLQNCETNSWNLESNQHEYLLSGALIMRPHPLDRRYLLLTNLTGSVLELYDIDAHHAMPLIQEQLLSQPIFSADGRYTSVRAVNEAGEHMLVIANVFEPGENMVVRLNEAIPEVVFANSSRTSRFFLNPYATVDDWSPVGADLIFEDSGSIYRFRQEEGVVKLIDGSDSPYRYWSPRWVC